MLNKLTEVAQTEGYKNLSEDIKALLAKGKAMPKESTAKEGKCQVQ